MKDENTPKPRSRQSSEYSRVVGKIKVAVINTKQSPKDATAAAVKKAKWAVMEYAGKTKKLVSSHAKKADAIASLLAREIELKAKAKS